MCSTGRRCKKSPLQGAVRCYQHTDTKSTVESSFPQAYNQECPICLETTDENWLTLECNHRLHLECAEGLITSRCPMCRSRMRDLPLPLAKRIRRNRRQHREEQNAEQAAMDPLLVDPVGVIYQFIAIDENTLQFVRADTWDVEEEFMRLVETVLASAGDDVMVLPIDHNGPEDDQ